LVVQALAVSRSYVYTSKGLGGRKENLGWLADGHSSRTPQAKLCLGLKYEVRQHHDI
jgi:hypothetical protein